MIIVIRMIDVEIVGFVAGILVAISVLPQVVKSRKTRSTKDVSLSRSTINLVGQILWIIYGVLIESYSLVVMSSITLIFNIIMIGLKVRF